MSVVPPTCRVQLIYECHCHPCRFRQTFLPAPTCTPVALSHFTARPLHRAPPPARPPVAVQLPSVRSGRHRVALSRHAWEPPLLPIVCHTWEPLQLGAAVVNVWRTADVPSLLLPVSSPCGTPYSLISLWLPRSNSPSLFSVCRHVSGDRTQ
jgi:hypothetical protein